MPVPRLAFTTALLLNVHFLSWAQAQSGVTQTIAQTGVGGVPGVAGANFSQFNSPVLNGAGETAFVGVLQTGVGGVTSSDDSGIWGPDAGGNLSLVAREGVGGVPGVAGANFLAFGSHVLNGAGETAFLGFLQTGVGGVTSSNDRGIWGPDSGGNLSLIAREGVGSVPGVAGANFSGFSGSPVLNGAGETAFWGSLQTGVGGVTSSNDSGIWGPDSGGNLSLVAREGVGGVPGVAGANFSGFSSPVLNGAGETAFYGTLQTGTGGVTSSNDSGIWGPDAGGNLSLIAREGVGGVPGISFVLAAFSSFSSPVLNGSGNVAFGAALVIVGGLTSSNDSGIWGPDPAGTLSLIAREGVGGVPGVAGANFSNFGSPALNSAGQTAFSGSLQTGVGGVTVSNDGGIWIGDGVELVEVQREGSSLAGGTVTGLALTANSGGEDGRPTGLNDYGQIAYLASLLTGQGIFLWTPTLHWRGTAGDGQWDSRTNFTLSTDPAQVHEVILDPASSVAITGGAGSTTVKSLQVGGGAGTVGLTLPAGSTLNAVEGVTLVAGSIAGSAASLAADTLTVQDGALSSSLSIATGTTKTSTGSVSISGSSSTLGTLSVEDGTLSFTAGNHAATTVYLNPTGPSTGRDLVVSGAGTTVTASGATFLGYDTLFGGVPLGTGAALTVGTGADFTTSALRIGGGNSVDIAGGTLASGLINSEGQLTNNGTIDLGGTGTLTVHAGGFLSGNGLVLGNLAVNSGGTLSPGNSPGTMSVVGNVTWGPSGTFLLEVNDATGISGADPGWDLLDATGTLTITASAGNEFTLDVDSLTLANAPGNAANFNPASSYSWTFASAVGGIVGFDPAAFLLDLSGFTNPFTGTFSVAQMGSNLNLLYTPPPAAVPEPATLVIWTGLGLALGGLGHARRSRRRSPRQARE